VVRFTPRPLYAQGKSPWYPLDRRLTGLDTVAKRKIPSLYSSSNINSELLQIIFSIFIGAIIYVR
jgi:hypothetical protein